MMELTVDKAFMVTRKTLQTQIKFGFLATGVMREREEGFLGKEWYKTVWDLLSDILSLRSGMKALFWIYEEEYGESFFGTYSVKAFSDHFTTFFHPKTIGNVSGINYPFRALIEPDNVWKMVVPSDLIFSDPKFSQFLWTIASKKSLGRGKSLVTLPPIGSKIMAEAAKAVENYVEKNEFWTKEEVTIDLPIETEEYPKDESLVELSDRWFSQVLEENDANNNPNLVKKIPRSPGELDIFKLPSKRGNEVLVEKVLEAWLSLNADRDLNLKKMLELKDLVWFSNYIPCTVSGANADFLLLGKSPDGLKLCILELKKGIVRKNELVTALQELRRYSYIFSTLIDLNLSRTDLHQKINVQPILVAKDIKGNISANVLNKFRHTIGNVPMLLKYDILDGKIEFSELKISSSKSLF